MILNIGSINIDYVYRVPHFVMPGETLACHSLTTVLGGKGANQSVAIARAGAAIQHVGRVCSSDQWAIDELATAGVGVTYIETSSEPSGHAIIQVDEAGENSIVLYGGANQQLSSEQLQRAFNDTSDGDWVLIQNECNGLSQVFELAKAHDVPIVFNPAPMTAALASLPLADAFCLIVNETEAAALVEIPFDANTDMNSVVAALLAKFPEGLVVLTLGAEGVTLLQKGTVTHIPTPAVQAVDTTGAGDTFVGYFMAALIANQEPAEAAQMACHAAAVLTSSEH